jgi:transcription termination/antitermination protein NusA
VNQDLLIALTTIEKERGINKEILFEAIEIALMSAYKRNFNHATNARVEIDRNSGGIKVFRSYDVVEEVINAQAEILVDEAKNHDPDVKVGETVEIEVTPKDFGRIAAQTAKQVVIQRIREAERDIIFEDYIDRIEEVVNGTVQRFEQKNVIVDLGRTEAVLPPSEQMPHEKHRQGERVKVFITEVKKTTKGPQVIVSRTNAGLLKRLFEMEVPEIFDGIIEIKAVAREAGFRSKIAVVSNNKDVDPVGACVGPKGARVQAITQELRGEKIDIIQWSEDPEDFIKSSLSPAKASYVKTTSENKVAQVVVPDNQLSLSIGREGQNARLAAKITGWKVDIMSESQVAAKTSEDLDDAIARIVPKKKADESADEIISEDSADNGITEGEGPDID